MKKQILTAAIAIMAIGATAQEKVRVHNGTQSYVTEIEYITFDATEADQAVSVDDLQKENTQLSTEKAALEADTATLKAANTKLESFLKEKLLYDDYVTTLHESVDLGLSVKWATMNVGANASQEYGCFFAWGETEAKEYYDWSTYKHMQSGKSAGMYINKYQIKDGQFDAVWYKNAKYKNNGGKTVLDAADDAATANWGGKWRMPTADEWVELYNNTTQTWTNNYEGTGVKGYILTSMKVGYEGVSIFLPAAGYRLNGFLGYKGSYGYYWSSSLDGNISGYGRSLDFYSGGFDPRYYGTYRYYGQSVRPVCPSAE